MSGAGGAVIAARDSRAEALAALIDDAFDGWPAFIWGAGASVPLVPTRLGTEAIIEFVRRCGEGVPDGEVFARHRLPLLAAVLDADLGAARGVHARRVLARRAAALRLDPADYQSLLHLSDAALGTLLSLWLTPEPDGLGPGPQRAGYDLLRHVPRGAPLITTNQDRLAPTLAPHLDVMVLNGQVKRGFLDPARRARALELYASSHRPVLPRRFVPLGS